MTTIEELKTQLVALEKERLKEKKIADDKTKEINNHPEMKKLIEDTRKYSKERDNVRKQKEKLEKIINEQFITISPPYTTPSFQHKTYEWGEETNIFDYVLDEIKKHAPLRLLRNGDIEDTVTALINKAANKCPELVKLQKRHKDLDGKIHEFWEKERTLHAKLGEGFHSKVYDLQQNISEINRQISNPKKFLEAQKRQNKRDEARNKLKDPKVLDGIYKKLHIVVPKSKTNKK